MHPTTPVHRRTPSPFLRALALLATTGAAAALALTGCAPAASEPVVETPSMADSPLENYLDPLYGRDDEAAADEKNRQVEYLTAACMAEEGFDYTPERVESLSSAEYYHPDDPSWVARFGYGVVEYLDRNGRATFYEPEANRTYVDSLQGAEYGEYYEALYGEENTDEGWATGCYGSSVIEVWGELVTQADENQPVMAEIDAFEASMQNDPDLAQIDAEWSECMAGFGYEDFVHQYDASNSMYSLVGPGYDPSDTQRRDELHEQEVELALADLDCRQQVDYTQRYTAIRFAAETRFIADHKAELDALILEAQAARAAAE